MTDMDKRAARLKWFQDARFGMFIHWGLYAIPARGEWVRSTEQIPPENYEYLKDEFNPVNYDPRQWAKLCRQAGMKYAVLTTKHHDGFCLFDSKLTDFKSTNTPCGRDLVREYVEAFRAEGLKVGMYYSLLDWHHPDYPARGRPEPPAAQCAAGAPGAINFERYLEYMHGQVRELMTNYGKIDLLWLDFSYDDMTAEKWKATELVRMVRRASAGHFDEQPFGEQRRELRQPDDGRARGDFRRLHLPGDDYPSPRTAHALRP